MKKLALTTVLLAVVSLSAHAGGYRYHGPYRSHHGSSVSVYFGGGYPCYSSFPSYSYSYYPSYGYSAYSYPAYGYDYAYSRPNYAVSGTLLGALTGGLIGNSVHHQGWEGAGIGAAAGLVLGSVAEHNARSRERAYYSAPANSYSSSSYIADAPTVNSAPTVPAAPTIQSAPAYQPVSAMSSANGLFGR